MKTKTYVLILLITCLLSGCTQTSTSYVITGKIEGLPEGAHIQLTPFSHNPEKPVADTVISPDGTFILTGKIEEPRLVSLSVAGYYGRFNFILENSRIRITGTVDSDKHNNATFYNFDNVTVSGSALSEEYLRKVSIRDTLNIMYRTKNEKHKVISELIGQARMKKDKAAADSLSQTEAYKSLEADEKLFFETVSDKYAKLISANKDSFWGPLLMISLMSYFGEEQKAWYEAMSDEAKNSYYGQLVKEELYPAGIIGQTALEFTVKDGNGKESAFSTLRQGKKYILIDFWASWCAPCRKEIPNLKKAYQQYADKGFEIISISIDKKESYWKKALEEEQLPWLNFLDHTDVANLYKVKAVPTVYLVDNKGILVAENIRGDKLLEKLAELFK
ncbi:MAG: redoxin domain-containing protein [Prevotellaceae bacterium]|jgi:thiol-disulfide isomerase/thioredoxin|nr:redoxin domain-containing protein [Prevotellaceae bacterium]